MDPEDINSSRQALSTEIFDQLLEGCQIIGSDWRYRYINDAAAAQGRRTKADLLGHRMMDVYPAIAETPLFKTLSACMQARTPAKLVNEFVYPDQSSLWFELRVSPVYDGIFIMSLDITESKQAERKIRDSRVSYRSLFEHMLEGFAYCKMEYENNLPVDFTYLEVNQKFEELTGLKNVVGKKVSEVIPGVQTSNPELFEIYGRVSLTGSPERFETHIPSIGIWFSISAYSNEKGYFIAVFDNITARKQAEEALQKAHDELEQRVHERTIELSDLYDNAPCGYQSLDGDGLIVRINDTELSWLGYSRTEIIGKIKFSDLLTPASQQIFKENFAGYKERGWVNNQFFEMVRRDGSILPVLLNGTVVKDAGGRFLMTRSTMIDYSDRKQAEQAIEKLNDSLEHRSGELETSNKELEAFAYSVSHDLRAPLRAIDGFSRILLEDYDDKLDDEGKRVLKVIRTNTHKMDQLISDLLALSRVSRVDLHLTRIDMSTLASAIYAELASPEVQKKFIFSVSAMPVAYGDPTLLRQVWSNLLLNAIKYTIPKEERRIEVGGYLKDGLNVYYVKDNGVGFNPVYTHKLFGVFQRLHKTEEFEGTGVGLAIVQRIIHRHGGLAWAEGKIDQGATIYFSIPVMEDKHE